MGGANGQRHTNEPPRATRRRTAATGGVRRAAIGACAPDPCRGSPRRRPRLGSPAWRRPPTPHAPSNTLTPHTPARRNQATPAADVAKRVAAGAAAALLTLAPAVPALANEFDVLGEPTPTSSYYVDDAGVLSKSTRSEVNKKLRLLEVSGRLGPA